MRRWISLLLLGAVLGLVASPGLAQSDDEGFLQRFLQDNLSDAGRTVTIRGFRGALSSRATVEELTVADATGIWLTLRGVTLDWNRAAVLRGRFSVNELSAEDLIIARPPIREPGLPSPEATGFSLPELPISIEIGKLAATRLELGPTVLGMPIEATLLASLQLAGGEGQAKLSLNRTDDGPTGRIALDASYGNATRLLVIDMDAEEGAGGIAATRLGLPGAPQTRLTVKGQGIVDDFAADIRLLTDGTDRLSGKVTLASGAAGETAFTATLGGDPAPLFLPEQAAFFGNDVRFDLAGTRSALGAVDLDRIAIRTRALDVDGTLALAPDFLPQRFALTGRIADPSGAPVLLPGSETLVKAADVSLRYDMAVNEGWSGSASLQGLSQPDVSVDQALLTGSGRIARGPVGNVIGATLRFVAAGLAPTDPGLSQALGQAVTGQAKLSWAEGQALRLSDLTVAGADYTLGTRGQIGGLDSGFRLKGTATLDARDLARFSSLAGRPLGGSVKLRATGNGSPLGGDFDLEGAVEGSGLTIGQTEVDTLLRGASSIGFSVARTTEGTFLRRLDLDAATLSVMASGKIASTGTDLTADLRFDDLRTLGDRYRGALTGTAKFSGTAQAGRFTLAAQGNGLAVGQAEADRLLRGKSTLSVALTTAGSAIRVESASLSNPQISVDATGTAQGSQREIALSAKLTDLALVLPDFPGPLTVTGTAVDDGVGYTVALRGTGPGQIDARVSGGIARDFGRADLSVAGTAQAALANPFIGPQSVAGPLRFDLRLNGPFTLNSLSGRASLTDGRISAPVQRLAVNNVGAQADIANGTARLHVEAAVPAGGRILVDGSVGLTAPFPGDLVIKPRSVVLRDPDLYETTASGKLRILGPLQGGALISGKINLTDTEIRVPSTDITGAGAIPDLEHRNEPAPVRATRARAGLLGTGPDGRGGTISRPFALDLTINAPSRVFIRGRGLDAELGGTLRIGGTTDQVVPSGGVNLIRGRLDILGRRLDLTEASLQLEGNLDPALRVVASNSSDGITSSVVIAGRVSEPEITFSSSPPLPEEEVLAHLLFGRQLTSLSVLQAAQLANAVAVLAGRGGEGIIGKLRQGFGLDDFDLVTDPDGGASVRLGKYIAKNIYTDVIIGNQGTSQLNLNFDIKPGVTVRGTADSEGDTGVGVFVERDY